MALAFVLNLGWEIAQVGLYTIWAAADGMTIASAWLGFAIGHFIGDLLNLNWLRLGALQLFSGSVGAWVALIPGGWQAIRP